jgi:hypothetical protein
MSATPDSTLANPEQLIADLERQLAKCKAERDDALEQQTATADKQNMRPPARTIDLAVAGLKVR